LPHIRRCPPKSPSVADFFPQPEGFSGSCLPLRFATSFFWIDSRLWFPCLMGSTKVFFSPPHFPCSYAPRRGFPLFRQGTFFLSADLLRSVSCLFLELCPSPESFSAWYFSFPLKSFFSHLCPLFWIPVTQPPPFLELRKSDLTECNGKRRCCTSLGLPRFEMLEGGFFRR